MSDHRHVQCERHGEALAAYVCQHLQSALKDREPRGVHWLYDKDTCVNAWCDRCDTFLTAHGNEWNDETEAYAGIRLICQNCFETLETFNEMKDLN